MKILHLYDGHEAIAGRGSVPNVVWNLATETAAQGHDVTVLERQWDGTEQRTSRDGVTIERIPVSTGADEPWERSPYKLIKTTTGAVKLFVDRTNFAFRTFQRLRQLEFDVVHVHLPFAANVLATAAPGLASRMIYTAHIGETESRVVEPRFSPDVWLAKRVARAIVLNPEMQATFESRGVNPNALRVIPNGVHSERFQNVSLQQCQTVETRYELTDTRIVLFVGTVTPRKGIKELMTATRKILPDAGEDVRFVVVGNTDMEPEYVDAAKAELTDEIADQVVFAGFVPNEEIPAFYRLADVFVSPSFEEGSSISVTEAIASQTPVVGSRIDGIRQQIDDGVHGRLVEPGDTDALADALTRLLSDPETRAEMTAALGERAVELSWPRVTERTVDVYAEVLR